METTKGWNQGLAIFSPIKSEQQMLSVDGDISVECQFSQPKKISVSGFTTYF